MPTEQRQFAETFHPGVFLEDLLEAHGWSQIDLAEILGRPPRLISEIISGKRGITPETAIGLSRAFGVSAQAWMNLETAYQLSKTQEKESDVAVKARLYDKFPVREMLRRGWIQGTTDIQTLKQRFFDYFHITSFDDDINIICARKSDSTGANTIQKAWLLRAKMLAGAVPVSGKFTKKALKHAKSKLRLLMHEEMEIRHVPKILADAGIRLVLIEPLPGSKIDGATFWINGDSEPVIVLSLRRDRIDNFWFTLMHELSHVENDEGKEEAIIDYDLLNEEGSNARPPEEIRADNDAAEFCIPEALLGDFVLRVHPYYLEAKIVGFAIMNKVHPGIVVGQLQHRQKIPFSHHRKNLVKVRTIIAGTAITDGYGYTPSI